MKRMVRTIYTSGMQKPLLSERRGFALPQGVR
jgi:hypothetical protein